MIGMRYHCKIVKVGNRLVQGRIDQQYGRLRHHNLEYLLRVIFYFRKVIEGTRNGSTFLLG